jgi:hypothetical protein
VIIVGLRVGQTTIGFTLWRLRLGSELLAPVLDCLLWKAMNLAILPLIQVAALRRLMMRTSERLTLTLPCSMAFRISSSLSANRGGEASVLVQRAKSRKRIVSAIRKELQENGRPAVS